MGSSSGTPCTPGQPSAKDCCCPLSSEAEGHLFWAPKADPPLGSEWVGGVRSRFAKEH